MGKRTDLIELDSSENIHANGIIPENCVIMAGFRDFEKGDGYEKFQEITYESLNEFNNDIANSFTILKFNNFYMTECYTQVYSESFYNIIDFENYIMKMKIRLVLHGFKQDLSMSNLKDIFNMPV